MFASSADTYTIPQKETRNQVLPPEPLLKIFLKTGHAPHAE